MLLSLASFYVFSEVDTKNSYFHIGWSNQFILISIVINTPFKYFTLCSFIVVSNVSEILMDNIAVPIIQFSTYNPYKKNITDFSRCELESFSNLLFFIQLCRRFLQIFLTLSQIDIAIISWLSSQYSAYIAIKYLLDNKEFTSSNTYIEVPDTQFYGSINI